DRVLRRIRELGDSGRQILLVPEHASHQAEVDLCRVCGDTAARHAEVLSFRRLSDRVLSITGGIAQTTLDAGGKLLTLQRCVAELAPSLTVYRSPARKAAFLSRLLDLFDELRAYEVSPEALFEKATQTPPATRDKLSDLSLLYGAYEARLREGGRDVRDLMTKLRDNLAASRYAEGKDVFLDGFSYFNVQERRILEILIGQAASVTVTLMGEAESREEIFEPAVKTLGHLRQAAWNAGCEAKVETMTAEPSGALGHLERYFFGDTVPWTDSGPVPVRLREAADILSEVEQTAADIRRLVSSGCARCRDITITARNMPDYAGTIEAVFARWDIPAYVSRRSDILEKPAPSLLTGALSAVTNGYEYEDMFRWLKTGLAGLTPEECDILENYVLKWEIHGAMWLRDTDWTDHPDGYGVEWTDRQRARLEQVNELRRRVRGPLSELAEGLKAAPLAGGKVEALYTFIERLHLQESLEEQMKRQAEAGRLQEAEETGQLWDILCGVLDQFMELCGPVLMDTDEFFRLFRQILTQYSVGSIPASLDQVSVAEMTRNDRHTSPYVFLLGANDHVLPAVGQSGGILNQEDRAELARQGVELSPTGMEQLGMELQTLYAALSQPTKGLMVSYPSAGSGGAELRPAFVIGRIQALFPSVPVERDPADKNYRLTAPVPALEAAGQEMGGPLWRYFEEQAGKPSPETDGSTENGAAEADGGTQADSAAEGAKDGSSDSPGEQAEREALRRKLDAMSRAAALRRGALSRTAVRALYGDRLSLSASRLERMRTCHFAYFMRYGLRAAPRDAAAFDAPQIGTFLHYLLEHVTRDVLAMGGFASVDNDTLHTLADKYIEQFSREKLNSLEGKNARFQYLFHRLRTTALSVIDQAAEELLHSDFVPLAFELSFGETGGDHEDGKMPLPAVTITEPDGELRIGGKVDRVDGWVKDDTLYLRVVDYKSGRKKFDLGAVRMGLDIQLLLYLFALERGGGERFGRRIEPAGVLYLPARDDILSAERNLPPEKLAQLREKEYRRSGLVLESPEVLQAMEHEALTEPHYLPLRVSRDGNLSGSLASAEQLGQLSIYLEKLLGEMAEELRSGCVDADPACHSEADSPCRFCDWAAACGFQDGRDTDRTRYIRPISQQEFWDLMDRDVNLTSRDADRTDRDVGGRPSWQRH
ncbi:MAG: PD-(D/E)XK nuclease family protein, partial [Oscillibacter sp.]|nr:PD-(D/E)XK nuclease family protein [Oscillibacter sp.]